MGNCLIAAVLPLGMGGLQQCAKSSLQPCCPLWGGFRGWEVQRVVVLPESLLEPHSCFWRMATPKGR